MAYKAIKMFFLLTRFHRILMYNEKQIIIVVQAAPKTHPGGIHGAWFKFSYQSDLTSVNKPPMDSAPKFSIKKIINL